MINVLVEASSPDLYAEVAEPLRDYSQLRLIQGAPDGAGDESQPRPSVVLAAIGARGGGAVESFAWNATDAPVILLVDHPARWMSQALPAGVRGVLPRNLTPAEMIGAIEAVAAGLFVFHPSDVDSLAMFRSPEAAPELGESLVEPLTPREVEVLQLLSEGLGNKEIASRLVISEHTAKFHVASIMGKLGAATRTEAVTQGIRHGLVMI